MWGKKKGPVTPPPASPLRTEETQVAPQVSNPLAQKPLTSKNDASLQDLRDLQDRADRHAVPGIIQGSGLMNIPESRAHPLMTQQMMQQQQDMANENAKAMARMGRVGRYRTGALSIRIAKLSNKQRRLLLWLWYGDSRDEVDTLSPRRLAAQMLKEEEARPVKVDPLEAFNRSGIGPFNQTRDRTAPVDPRTVEDYVALAEHHHDETDEPEPANNQETTDEQLTESEPAPE